MQQKFCQQSHAGVGPPHDRIQVQLDQIHLNRIYPEILTLLAWARHTLQEQWQVPDLIIASDTPSRNIFRAILE